MIIGRWIPDERIVGFSEFFMEHDSSCSSEATPAAEKICFCFLLRQAEETEPDRHTATHTHIHTDPGKQAMQ